MEVKISFKHLESTPAIESRIRQKAERLKKYFHGKISVHWVCSVLAEGHRSEVKIHGGHRMFHAHANDDNLYKTFDLVVAKLEKQLVKEHDKAKNRIHSA